MPASPCTNFDELEFLSASLSGDVHAYTRIVERYQTLVWSVAMCATGDESLAEELAQEAFITAWNRLPELREMSRFRSWLCGIVRNHARTWRRHAERHVPDLGRRCEVADMAGDRPTQLDQVIVGEQHRMLGDAIAGLPDSYREPLVLFYGEELPIREIAELLDVSEDTVRQRLSRGRRQLRVGIAAAVGVAITASMTRAAAASGSLTLSARPVGFAMASVAAAVAAIVFISSGARSAPETESSAATAPSRAMIDSRVGPETPDGDSAQKTPISGAVELGRGDVQRNDHPAEPADAVETTIAHPRKARPVRSVSTRRGPARGPARIEGEVRHGPAVIERPALRPTITLDDIR